MKKILFSLIILLIGPTIKAQNEVDAFRLSQFYSEGTARSMAMANAFGAIGSDLSAAVYNPAGIGFFNHFEFTYTPSLLFHKNEVTFNNSKVISPKNLFYTSNLGIIFPINLNEEVLKNINFSFGYNRLNNYKQNINVSGINPNGSMLDYFMLSANGNTPNTLSDFSTWLAFDTWLIDTVQGTNGLKYTNPLWFAAAPNAPVYGQRVTRYDTQKGGAGEMFMNAAFNFKDILFLGATLSIPSGYYEHQITHTEDNFVDTTDLRSFSYTEILSQKFEGVNFKAGLIFQPIKFIRIGGSISTPTYYTINEKFSSNVESHWKSPDADNRYDYYQNSPKNEFKYHLSTPTILRANLGIIVAPVFLIGLDYENIDYSGMFMSADDYLFTTENSTIDTLFKSVNNLRAGAEINLGVLRFRGGYALFGNPYSNSQNVFERNQISAGLGLNSENFYFDFAYTLTQANRKYAMYNGYIDEPIPKITSKISTYTVTFGIKF